MSTVHQSSPVPGAPHGREAATGTAAASPELARALLALEALDESLPHIHELGTLAMRLLPEDSDADEALAVLKGQASLALNACSVVFDALRALGQRGAA